MRRRISPRALREKRALIALSLVPGIGLLRMHQLLEMIGSADEIMSASQARLAALPGIGSQTAAAIAGFDEALVEEQVGRALRADARMVTHRDERYPKLLRHIAWWPPYLWVRGMLPAEEPRVAVVGTRRPTAYGRRIAQQIAFELASLGITVVSGLAYGIDAFAHRGAVEAGGRTIAVLGSGVDRVYPGTHASIARDILERGAVISEFPMGAKPEAGNFPRRNRIVSGLCHGTLVVEAFEGGGALITAGLALEQNREVFAIPGPIDKKASCGTNKLIQLGEAKLVQNVDDMLDELPFAVKAREVRAAAVQQADLTAEERALCRALGEDTLHIDRLCAASGLDTSAALVHLLNLEFKGIVRQLAGRQFSLARSIDA